MSPHRPLDHTDAEFIAMHAASFRNQPWAVAATAFALYDWAMTLSRESKITALLKQVLGFACIMLHDGLAYLVVLSMQNILYLTLTQLTERGPGGTGAAKFLIQSTDPYVNSTVYTDITNVPVWPYLTSSRSTVRLSSVLISRFLLHLQEAHQKAPARQPEGTGESPGSESFSSVDFADALWSLGVSITLVATFGTKMSTTARVWTIASSFAGSSMSVRLKASTFASKAQAR